MFSHRIYFLLRDSPTDFTHRSYGAFKGVHLSPLGFAACQSKKCTNTTKSIFSHRIQNTFLLGYSPTDFTLSLQKNATQSHKLQNDQGKTMIAKDSFVPLL